MNWCLNGWQMAGLIFYVAFGFFTIGMGAYLQRILYWKRIKIEVINDPEGQYGHRS